MASCFSGSEEVVTFTAQMDQLAESVCFSKQVRNRVSNDNASLLIILEQIAVFCFFCREHIDLIQQLISKLEYRELTDEEMKEEL